MAGNFETDIAKFFNTNHFAQAATYTPATGAASTVNGIFEDEYKEVNPLTSGVETREPTFTCATASIASPKHAETLTIGGVVYYILNPRPDGTGMTIFRLSKETPHG